jgi:hypothetical protein
MVPFNFVVIPSPVAQRGICSLFGRSPQVNFLSFVNDVGAGFTLQSFCKQQAKRISTTNAFSAFSETFKN